MTPPTTTSGTCERFVRTNVVDPRRGARAWPAAGGAPRAAGGVGGHLLQAVLVGKGPELADERGDERAVPLAKAIAVVNRGSVQ
jgi:hypothetical protein